MAERVVKDFARNIQRLSRRDLPLMRAHLLRLDSRGRYERFGMAVNDRFLCDYAAKCFEDDALVFAYCEDGVARGVIELHGLGQRHMSEWAETAFSVDAGWRGRGVGSAMLTQIIETARALGAQTLYLTCSPQNRATQALVHKFQLRVAAGDRPAHIAKLWRESRDEDGYYATLDLVEPVRASA